MRYRLITACSLTAVVAGLLLQSQGQLEAADIVWAPTMVAMLVPLTTSVVRSVRHGRIGVDAIALVAMVGALALGEFLAGSVIALMLAGGIAAAPTEAHRRRGDQVEEVTIDALIAGDQVRAATIDGS